MKRSGWGIARRLFSNLLFDGSLRGHKGLYGKSHQLMVFAEAGSNSSSGLSKGIAISTSSEHSER